MTGHYMSINLANCSLSGPASALYNLTSQSSVKLTHVVLSSNNITGALQGTLGPLSLHVGDLFLELYSSLNLLQQVDLSSTNVSITVGSSP
jgi:hypothetical protein